MPNGRSSNRSFLFTPADDHVAPTVIRFAQYLAKTGWIKIEQNDSKILVYGTTDASDSGSEAPILIFPTNDNFSDAKPRINDAIQAIAAFRGKQFSDILTEVFCYDADILRQRIDIPQLRGISLKIMPELVRHYRELISKSTQLEVFPKGERPYRLGKSNKAIQKGKEVVEKCLFGHTFAGSFGISIEVPVEIETNLFPEVSHCTATLERLTMQRIATGLSDAHTAMRNGQIGVISKNLENGFNADICQTMAELLTVIAQIEESPRVEYSFGWSPLIVPDSTFKQAKPITFTSGDMASVFNDAAKEMIKLHRSNPVTVKGEILTLTDDPEKKDTDEKKRRTITIRCKNKSDLGCIKITCSTEDDYNAACLARGHGNWLSARGILINEGQGYRLRNPQNLKALPPLFDEDE